MRPRDLHPAIDAWLSSHGQPLGLESGSGLERVSDEICSGDLRAVFLRRLTGGKRV